MASKVSTVKVIDKRIEPQPEPVYSATIGPQQNQFYKISASGLSDSYITFNNLTTLGADRAYLDTFELEITAEITWTASMDVTCCIEGAGSFHCPRRDLWTFDSFPFAKCCEEVRVNVNGGAFFSSPLSYVRAKERYWDQKKINDAYGNVCPCNKPWVCNELAATCHRIDPGVRQFVPTRLWPYQFCYGHASTGVDGTRNNDIVPEDPVPTVSSTPGTVQTLTQTVTWREPVFASPFSSRMDQTYGRPLYNITSLDLAFNMQDLGNMIRCCAPGVANYSVHLQSIQLCYQVMTLPPTLARPPQTVVPYRRFVPYITDSPKNGSGDYAPRSDGQPVQAHISSGVYTFNEIPTAIWIFVAPTKANVQMNKPDGFTFPENKPDWFDGVSNGTPESWWGALAPTWTFNKTFCPIKHVNLTCANTTQILATATPHDLYRIAKANGCQDSFTTWERTSYYTGPFASWQNGWGNPQILTHVNPTGSVLRLIPGTDIIIPDQQLIPGSNANNMVFQAHVAFDIPDGYPPNFRDVSLWLLFEYVGVATITPGQCQIDMNPLGNAVAALAQAPVVSGSISEPPSEVEGSGWLSKIERLVAQTKDFAKKYKVLSTAAQYIPYVGPIAGAVLNSLGYGEPGTKRTRPEPSTNGAGVSGGAVMGYGDFC